VSTSNVITLNESAVSKRQVIEMSTSQDSSAIQPLLSVQFDLLTSAIL